MLLNFEHMSFLVSSCHSDRLLRREITWNIPFKHRNRIWVFDKDPIFPRSWKRSENDAICLITHNNKSKWNFHIHKSFSKKKYSQVFFRRYVKFLDRNFSENFDNLIHCWGRRINNMEQNSTSIDQNESNFWRKDNNRSYELNVIFISSTIKYKVQKTRFCDCQKIRIIEKWEMSFRLKKNVSSELTRVTSWNRTDEPGWHGEKRVSNINNTEFCFPCMRNFTNLLW